jgi:transposase InsO family protein
VSVADDLATVLLPCSLLVCVMLVLLVAVEQRRRGEVRRARRAEAYLNQAESINHHLAREVGRLLGELGRLRQPAAPRWTGERLLTDRQDATSYVPDALPQLPAHVRADQPVWMADHRQGVAFHALTRSAQETKCHWPVFRPGVTLPAAVAAATWSAYPCPRCFPADVPAVDCEVA